LQERQLHQFAADLAPLTSDGQWPSAAVLTTVVSFAVIYTDSDGGKISELLLSLVCFILSFDIDFHLSISFDDGDDDEDNGVFIQWNKFN